MTGPGEPHDPLDDILAQAQLDAVRSALRPAETAEQMAEVAETVRATIR